MKSKIANKDDSNGLKAAAIKRGRRQIAGWLRRQAAFLEQSGPDMARRFRARWLYTPREQ